MDYEIIEATSGEGLAALRNEGIKNCKAKYIIFGAPGVFMEEGTAEYLIEEMESTGCGMASCGYDIMTPETDVSAGLPEEFEVYYMSPEFNRRVMDSEDMLCRLFYQTHYQGFIWNKVFRTETIRRKRIRFDTDIPGSEEMPFLIRYIRSIREAVMLPEILFHIHDVPEADIDCEIEAYKRMKKKLWRHADARWLCEQNIELLEIEREPDTVSEE